MSYFSKQDMDDVRNSVSSKDEAYNRVVAYENAYICIREQVIKDISYGYEIFKEIVKEYPQLASKKGTPENFCAFERGLFGKERKKAYFFYRLGLQVRTKMYRSGYPGYASLRADQKGTIYEVYSNVAGQGIVRPFLDEIFKGYLDESVTIKNKSYYGGGGSRQLDIPGGGNLFGTSIEFIYGNGIIKSFTERDDGYSHTEFWMLDSTIDNFTDIKAPTMLPKESIIQNMVEYLKGI